MKQYFIHDGKSQLGPFSIQELKIKSLNGDTPVWYVGLGKWTTAAQVPELKALFSNSTEYHLAASSIPTIAIANGNSPVLPASFGKRILSRTMLIWGLALTGSAILFWLILQFQQETASANQTQPKEQVSVSELSKKKMNYRNSWSNFIGLANIKYAAKATGGNEAFDIYVQNSTAYPIDEVELTINYLKKSGDILKTEIVTVSGVPAYSEKAGIVPENKGGVSVTAKITAIRCTALNLCFPNAQGAQGDPYFCK